MIILTSNLEKIQEIRTLYPELIVTQGPDLREVMGNKDQVIIYKALEAGMGHVVEDTILEIDGQEVVDIRWKLGDLKEGMYLKWVVSLGYYTSHGTIKIYRGSVDGIITLPDVFPEDAFGFDLYFKPVADQHGKTLYQLQKEGKKNTYSPRAIALKNLIDDKPLFIQDVNSIKPWIGKYQTDT